MNYLQPRWAWGYLVIVSILGITLFFFTTVQGQTAEIEVVQNRPFIDFPRAIDFSLIANTDKPIAEAELIYGVDALSCNNVSFGERIPLDGTTDVNVTANWDVVAAQILPPGSRFWWEWRLTTADGEIIEVPREQTTFDDGWFVWQSIEREDVTVYWYRGDDGYPTEILEAAIESRETLARDVGYRLEDPVELFLYDETFDLVRSIPGAPQWAGGVAFPEHNIIMVAANDRSEEIAVYGVRTTRHEFGHLVIGRLTYNCLNGLPTWLNEGLAQVAEGEPDQWNIDRVAEAAANDQLLTLNQLEGNFSIHTERASLSYAQSDRFSRYLIETYGADEMLNLLTAFSVGETVDRALLATYGKTKRTLENEWRETLNAMPADDLAEVDLPDDVAQETLTPVPTLGLLMVDSPTETPIPTEPPIPTDTPAPTPMPTDPPPSPSPTVMPTEIAALSNVPADAEAGQNSSEQTGSTGDAGGIGLGAYFVIGLILFVIIGVLIVSIVLRRSSSG